MGLNANVLNNTLEFLRRVETKGLEAFAFVEAYTAIQNEHALTISVTKAYPTPPSAPQIPEPYPEAYEEPKTRAYK